MGGALPRFEESKFRNKIVTPPTRRELKTQWPQKPYFEKIWDEHVVREKQHEPSLLYIDLHLVHEVTSPQAFEGLRHSGRKVRAPHRTYATQDHNVPTTDRSKPITDADSKLQIETLRRNCAEFGLGCSISARASRGSCTLSGRSSGSRSRA